MSGNVEESVEPFQNHKNVKNKRRKLRCQVCNPSLRDVQQKVVMTKKKEEENNRNYCACRLSENVTSQRSHCVLEKRSSACPLSWRGFPD